MTITMTMRNMLAVLCLALLVQNAWAIDIGDAKEQGLVGETNKGLIAAVRPPASAEVRALIEEVNAKRMQSFENTAKKTGATVEQVAYRFYELAVQKTAKGHYYQDASGRWQQK